MKKVKYIFFIYSFILFFLVIFKFSFNLEQFKENIEILRSGYDLINLKLFNTIKMQIDNLNEEWAIRNLIGNTTPFVIYGVLYSLSFNSNLIKDFFINLIIILCLESIQLIFKIGTFDIDDIFLNVFSIMFGIYFMKKVILVNKEEQNEII